MSLERLLAATSHLNADEIAVLVEVAEGLVRGRAVYGPLDPDSDERNFLNEAAEELRDCMAYIGTQAVRVRRMAGR